MARVEVDECPTCHRKKGELHQATEPRPSDDELEGMVTDRIDVTATDGCRCDPDGSCEHGHVSWLRRVGII